MEGDDLIGLRSLSINLLGVINHKYGPKFRPIYGVKFCHLVPALYHHLVAVGGNRISVYEAHNKGLDLIQKHTDEDVEEDFYACCWAVRSNRPVVVVGGSRAIIKVVDNLSGKVNILYGHGESINEIKTHPLHPHIIFSCSTDRSIRMWNINTLVCVAIFAGEKGHTENVIDFDLHPLGNAMVSGGADTNIMIWNLQDPCLLNAIEESNKYSDKDKFTFPTYIQQAPLYSTNRVHVGYIDMCVWVHDLLLTKSTNDRIVLWAVDANRYKDAFCVVREFRLRDSAIWFMRGAVCMALQIVAVGNGAGQVNLYPVYVGGEKYGDNELGKEKGSERFQFDQHVAKLTSLALPEFPQAVRQVSFSADAKYVAFGQDGGILQLWGLRTSL